MVVDLLNMHGRGGIVHAVLDRRATAAGAAVTQQTAAALVGVHRCRGFKRRGINAEPGCPVTPLLLLLLLLPLQLSRVHVGLIVRAFVLG